MQHVDTGPDGKPDLPNIHLRLQEVQEAARSLYESHPQRSSVGALYQALLHALVEVTLEISKLPR